MDSYQFTLPRRIFLARHGQSLANLNKQITGQLDSPLSDKGKDQSYWLKDVLKNESLSAIYTSTLQRTIETARPTATDHNLPIQELAGFKEMHFGILQGKGSDETERHVSGFRQTARALFTNTLRIEGAETFQDFERRVVQCLTGLLSHTGDSILIVGHRNTNEVILTHLLKLNPLSASNINIKNKYVYEILTGPIPQVTTIRLGGEHHGKKFKGFKDD